MSTSSRVQGRRISPHKEFASAHNDDYNIYCIQTGSCNLVCITLSFSKQFTSTSSRVQGEGYPSLRICFC